MKQLVIIGAGGMGRSLYDLARDSWGYGIKFNIKGFIDDNLQAMDGFKNYPPLLGKIETYIPQENDCFISSIGGNSRRHCTELILQRGGDFLTLIHQTARIGTNAKLGKGNIIAAYSNIGADATIGDYNMIQSYSIIGHDAVIGNWNRIDTHVTCVGGVWIGNEVTVHTSAVLNHKVIVEDKAHIGACSFVIRKVLAGTTVIGNPAKRLL